MFRRSLPAPSERLRGWNPGCRAQRRTRFTAQHQRINLPPPHPLGPHALVEERVGGDRYVAGLLEHRVQIAIGGESVAQPDGGLRHRRAVQPFAQAGEQALGFASVQCRVLDAMPTMLYGEPSTELTEAEQEVLIKGGVYLDAEPDGDPLATRP